MKNISRRLFNRVKYQALGIRGRKRRKVICLGLSRTGTTSLSHALSAMGIPTIHFPPMYRGNKQGGLEFDWKWWFGLYDGFADISALYFYRRLDEMFPNTKFLLTKRDLESWLQSCSVHFDNETSGSEDTDQLRLMLYGTVTYDEHKFRDTYLRHQKAIKEFFANRPDDLLEIDICGGESMERMCTYLDLPLPDNLSFPRLNSQKRDTVRR